MEYSTLLYSVDSGIGTITINRPKALNALNSAVMNDFADLLPKIAADPEVKVVIITGSGEKSFVAGADITEMQKMAAIAGRNWAKFGIEIFDKIENLPQTVIAAVNGFALGGGCELSMACDIRIAAENALFGQPEVGLGITPGFGGTQRLPRLVGKGIAKELIFTASNINAQEAYRIGLVNKVVPAAELMEAANKMAKKIMSKSLVAVHFCKAAINEGMNVDLKSGTAYESEVFGLCFASEDQAEGMTAFVEKRKPTFTGK